MNKLYLGAIVAVALMLTATYMSFDFKHGSSDIVNQIAVIGAVVLVIATIFVVVKYVRQMQVDTATGELTDESWDGVGEYNNPVPTGWAVIFALTMIWGMWYYIAGYPVNAYSQIGEYNEEVASHNIKYKAALDEKTKDMTPAQKKNYMIAMGESVFMSECVACHGLQGNGNNGNAANLKQRVEAKVVKNVVINGSNNHLLGTEMPMPDRNGLFNANTGALITDAEIDAVAAYVSNGMKGAGSDVFAGVCSSCHGADGKGMEYVAPNIAEFTPVLVTNVLNHGKKGVIGKMPAFQKLNDSQKHAVGEYISAGLPDVDDLEGE